MRKNLTQLWVAFALVTAAAATQTACNNRCGKYELNLPETLEIDDRFKRNPIERCEHASQGGWVEGGESYITFQPDEGGLSANFVYTNMLITVVFQTDDAIAGETLTDGQLGGNAFFGLGYPRHYDEAPLKREESWLTFHDIGEESGDGLYRERIIDVEWHLVWERGESRWFAEGRSDLPFLRSTR